MQREVFDVGSKPERQSLYRVCKRWLMRRTADELVAYSVDCLEAHRIVRFFLQLLA